MNERLIYLILIGIALTVGCCALIEATSAELLYSANFTPKNNLYEDYVHQGDTIYLGKTYDLTGVSGLSYEYAYWSDWKKEDTDCNPDKVVDIRYYRTFTTKNSVYLDPEVWNVGRWYAWNGYECNITYYDFESQERKTHDEPFQSENKFLFTIAIAPTPAPVVVTVTSEPIETYRPYYTLTIPSTTATPTPAPKKTDGGATLTVIGVFGLIGAIAIYVMFLR